MKKIIDIPDEMVRDIKILAAKSDKAVKHYLEDAILKEVQQGNYNELANYALRDGQMVRGFWNYLNNTFEAIKGKEFSFDEKTFNDEVEFYTFIMDVCHNAIFHLTNTECD